VNFSAVLLDVITIADGSGFAIEAGYAQFRRTQVPVQPIGSLGELPPTKASISELCRGSTPPTSLSGTGMAVSISPEMKKFSVLIYRCCRLRPEVAVRGSEINGADAVRAEGARECQAAMYRFDCVISHTIILFLVSVPPWDRRMTIVWGPETAKVREHPVVEY